MLTELYISNFAIIDDLRLGFVPGFNVLTGETGAGKSIILDAMTLVLGGRADTSMVRAGCDQAFVEATFRLSPALRAVVTPLLKKEGLDEGDNEYLVLARELRINGRNICRVNGRTVNLSILRSLAGPLVDIHGQGEHLSLLQPKSHLPLLDSFAGLAGARRTLAAEVRKLTAVRKELASLQQDKRAVEQRISMLEYQIQEIAAAGLKPGEDDELKAERVRLANAEQLARYSAEAEALLEGIDDDSLSITDMMGQVERALIQLAKLDDSNSELLETVQGLGFQLSEVAETLQTYHSTLEFNPDRLNVVEERLELISQLKRKYGTTIEEILAARDSAEAELDQISHSEERSGELSKQADQLLHRIGKMGEALSAQRQTAGEKLASAVVTELQDLSMEGARFAVQFTRETDPNGAYVGDERVAFDTTGIDRAEFVLSANPGEPLKPMAKVASGGETARLMLALKTALAQVDETPTLIFDEIDQGIGGRVGDVVGRKLWGLTAVADHQVIVVTHLPQLAGYGDIHYHVSKKVVDDRTATAVTDLDLKGRILELAAMLGTQDESARSGAESILRNAKDVKKHAANVDGSKPAYA